MKNLNLNFYCFISPVGKPRFKKPLAEKTEVDEGASLTLEVECHGCPEPEIKWFKDGKEVSTDAHIKITRDSHRIETYSMSLNLVKASDSGEYEVKATNTMGTVSSKTIVHVYSEYFVVLPVGQEKMSVAKFLQLVVTLFIIFYTQHLVSMKPPQACIHLPFSLYIIAKTTETTSETREEITTEEITEEETKPVEEVVAKKPQAAQQEGKHTFRHYHIW